HLVAIKKAFLQEAEAHLLQGESNLERMRGLYRDKVISPQQMEQEETGFQVLQARWNALKSELAEARRKLEETRIDAPFDGVITRIYAEPGEHLSPGAPLVEIANRNVELHVAIPESLLGSVQPGQSVDVVFPLLEHRKITGILVSLGDALGDDQKGALFPVNIKLPQEVWLRSGMTAEAIFTSPLEGDLLVPVSAVCNGDGAEDFLFVVRQGVARRVPVSPLEILGDSVTIAGEVREGEMAVVGGHAFLEEGDSVEVRPWK
ncbi:MAG TPA: efflux RND transporter periplasmic adaptor subunit, partial [Synergistaceae bacterium]|nr:efflux RND transporter periplasmic adaptor subunit [Synergistaceae bacterium]